MSGGTAGRAGRSVDGTGYANVMRILPLSKYAGVLRYWAHNVISRTDRYPFYASFKITSRCHFRCPFCDMWQDPYPDLSTGDVKKVLSNLGRSSILLVSLEGGEPLMRSDIEEILRFARTQPFYLFITTSEKTLPEYPMSDYGPMIDFLHISIDEGHRNMEMFDELEAYTGWDPQVTVQTVVTRDTLPVLDWKVQRCSDAGTMIVIMPAVDLDEESDYCPDPGEFRSSVSRLKKEYPGTVIDPDGYLDAINSPHGCSSASIIIRSDGALYYPCRVLGDTFGNLVESELSEIVRSEEAQRGREVMARCERACGWYQYFSIRSYTDPRRALPLLAEQLKRRKGRGK